MNIINWLRPDPLLLMCAKSSHDSGLDFRHYNQDAIDSIGITASSFIADIQTHIDNLSELVADDSDAFSFSCYLKFDGGYKYLAPDSLNLQKIENEFLNKIDSISKLIDDCLNKKLPFVFSFNFMDWNDDEAPHRYLYEYVKVKLYKGDSTT